ncbi:MAG: threonine synthase [Deltaproteobacteria bacterium]|nr:threonine synthase [Deltaproteobacteria bacterium]
MLASARRKPFTKAVSFATALLMGQAPDEGLFMPNAIPRLDQNAVLALKGLPYSESAKLVANLFLADEITVKQLERVVEESYNFAVPMERVYDRKYIMRLDGGPTASFKDFAARMMARWMSLLNDRHLNILVATSGDTGSAIGSAFHHLEGITVTILYPRDEVSELQQKQLDTIGDNVQALSVDGKFDDCQQMVKQAFADENLADYNLNSANSINFGRIIPQIIYYIYAYAQLANSTEKIIFSVPSGNFGNALGCEYARRMGLPVKRLLMPVNGNDEFPHFLATGHYQIISPSRACLSNAMNVGNPSNLARFFDLYGGTIDREGFVHRQPDISAMRKNLFSVSISDEKTVATIKAIYDKYGILLEPHGAVAWCGLEEYLQVVGDEPLCVALETAHPAKFPEAIKKACGITPTSPQALRDLSQKQGVAVRIATDYEEFKSYLTRNLPK